VTDWRVMRVIRTVGTAARRRRLLALLLLLTLLVLPEACTVIADVDYNPPPDQPPDTFDGFSEGSAGAGGTAS